MTSTPAHADQQDALTPTPVPSALDPNRAPSVHYLHDETGQASENIGDLMPNQFMRFTEALEYVAFHITTAWCWQCHDTGVIATTWGPHEGCAEFMTEPEVQFCDCHEGWQAKEADARMRANASDTDEV